MLVFEQGFEERKKYEQGPEWGENRSVGKNKFGLSPRKLTFIKCFLVPTTGSFKK